MNWFKNNGIYVLFTATGTKTALKFIVVVIVRLRIDDDTNKSTSIVGG